MIKHFIEQWEERKGLLKESFEKEMPEDYEDIYRRLFSVVITEPEEYSLSDWDWERFRVFDDGDYQGNKIFVLCSTDYQPSLMDYIFTNVAYGSCSGCDAFQGIDLDYNIEAITKDEAISRYMTLSLHMVQETKTFNDY
jgi:hypothetical protein